jgi:predicted acetyltransferase
VAVTLRDVRNSPELLSWLKPAYSRYLSELVAFDPEMYSLDPDGNWQPDYLPYWLTHDYCHPLVIVADGQPAGFVFVGEQPFPFMTEGRDYRLCEFFVDAPRRRGQVGRDAVRAVLASRPGAWELFVLRENAGALSFWTTVVNDAAGPVTCETDEHGVLLSFTYAGSDAAAI